MFEYRKIWIKNELKNERYNCYKNQQHLDDYLFCWFKHELAHCSILMIFKGYEKEFN